MLIGFLSSLHTFLMHQIFKSLIIFFHLCTASFKQICIKKGRHVFLVKKLIPTSCIYFRQKVAVLFIINFIKFKKMKHLIIYKSVPLGALGNVLEDSSSFSSFFSSLAVVEFVILKSPLFAESWMACIRLLDAFVLLV